MPSLTRRNNNTFVIYSILLSSKDLRHIIVNRKAVDYFHDVL